VEGHTHVTYRYVPFSDTVPRVIQQTVNKGASVLR